MAGQTDINTCIVSKLNNQNIHIRFNAKIVSKFVCINKEDNINKSEVLNGRTNEHLQALNGNFGKNQGSKGIRQWSINWCTLPLL